MRPEAKQLPHGAPRAGDRLLRVKGLQLRKALCAVRDRLDDDLGLDLLVSQHRLQRTLELLHGLVRDRGGLVRRLRANRVEEVALHLGLETVVDLHLVLLVHLLDVEPELGDALGDEAHGVALLGDHAAMHTLRIVRDDLHLNGAEVHLLVRDRLKHDDGVGVSEDLGDVVPDLLELLVVEVLLLA